MKCGYLLICLLLLVAMLCPAVHATESDTAPTVKPVLYYDFSALPEGLHRLELIDDYQPGPNEIGPALKRLGQPTAWLIQSDKGGALLMRATSRTDDDKLLPNAFGIPENSLSVTGSFTWEMRVRVDEFNGANHHVPLLDNSRGDYVVCGFDVVGSQTCRLAMTRKTYKDTDYRFIFILPTRKGRPSIVLLGTKLIPLHQVVNVAVAYDHEAGKATLYVNGNVDAEMNGTSEFIRPSGATLAGVNDTGMSPKHGSSDVLLEVDSLAISNVARTPQTMVLGQAR
ncbi:MAG: hypothetical protein IT440_04215 [Phycisphaeraceae bacterium]|nr:hypothetical protein [Phycisphaeraceae bacterium]